MKAGKFPHPETRYGWLMVAVASVFIGMALGTLNSISVFLSPLNSEFGWLRGETALAYTSGTIAMGLGGVVAGHLADRFSVGRIALLGSAAFGISLLLLANQNSLWRFYLSYCLMGGLGVAALYAPLTANVGSWFDRNKGLALGIVTAGQALGNGLVPFFARYLITASGWRMAYQTMGFVSFGAFLPMALLVRPPPARAPEGDSAGDPSSSSSGIAQLPPPGVIVPWLSAAVICSHMCRAIPIIHVVALAQDKGIDAQSAAGILLFLNISGFLARIGFGRISDIIGGVRAWMLASASVTAVVFWFTQVDSLTGFTLLAILFGLSDGAVTCCLICVRELVSESRRGVSVGIVILSGMAGMGIGAYLGGLLFDTTGDYVLSYISAATSSGINLLILTSLLVYLNRTRAALQADADSA